MKDLEQIKKEYEDETGFTSAKIIHPYLSLSDKAWEIISNRYAQEQVKAKLQEAAENFEKMIENDTPPKNDWAEGYHAGIEESASCLRELIPSP